MGKGKRPPVKVGWAHAFRDIVITSINRGQILPLIISLLTLAIIFKLPPSALETVVFRIFDGQVGYISPFLVVGIVVAWNFHCKKARKQFSEEFERIGVEKSELQRLLHNNNFESSNKR